MTRVESSSNLLTETLLEYTQSSGLHGVRYLGERDMPWTEKIWWICSTLGSFMCITCLILQTWQQWTYSPVLVSFADQSTAIWDIPFPTVTICPASKYKKKVLDMEKIWTTPRNNMTDEERTLSDDLLLVCRTRITKKISSDYPLFTDEKTLKNLINISPSMKDSVQCQQMLHYNKCDWLEDPFFTRDGVCYSYNALPKKSVFRSNKTVKDIWSLEKGYYEEGAGFKEPPRRVLGAGFLYATLLIIKTNTSELDLKCKPIEGMKLTLTNPADVPRVADNYFFLPVRGATKISVIPQVTDTDEALRSYHPHQRHCYFPSERSLAYFSTYTQANCEFECFTNYTFRACRCVEFYMPRNSSTAICAYGSSLCTQEAEISLAMELKKNIQEGKNENLCDCLPSCKSIEYTAEISQVDLDVELTKKYLGVDRLKAYENVTANLVYIFMKESEFRPLRRRELYGFTAFIANCGGLLGLCCGFSLISIAEALYFFTFRMWNNSRKNKANSVIPLNEKVKGGISWEISFMN